MDRKTTSTFVAPMHQDHTASQLPALIEAEPLHIEAALQAQTGADERTSAFDRALGLALRITPFTCIWAVITVGVGRATGIEWWAGFMLWGALTFVSYTWLDSADWRHSRSGVERHKIDRTYQLKRIEMESMAEARRMAVAAYIKMLEKHHD